MMGAVLDQLQLKHKVESIMELPTTSARLKRSKAWTLGRKVNRSCNSSRLSTHYTVFFHRASIQLVSLSVSATMFNTFAFFPNRSKHVRKCRSKSLLLLPPPKRQM